MPDIEPVDHRRSAFGDAFCGVSGQQRLEIGQQIGTQPPRVDHQEAPRLFRTLRLGIEGEPGGDRLRRELVGVEADTDDGRKPVARRLALFSAATVSLRNC